MDHAGILRDSKTGRPINGYATDEPGHESDDDLMRKSMANIHAQIADMALAGYSFFDSGDIELLGDRKRSHYHNVGTSMSPLPSTPACD